MAYRSDSVWWHLWLIFLFQQHRPELAEPLSWHDQSFSMRNTDIWNQDRAFLIDPSARLGALEPIFWFVWRIEGSYGNNMIDEAAVFMSQCFDDDHEDTVNAKWKSCDRLAGSSLAQFSLIFALSLPLILLLDSCWSAFLQRYWNSIIN